MSGKGNCHDNSMVETFFKSLKAEMIRRNRRETRRQAEGVIFRYINGSAIRAVGTHRRVAKAPWLSNDRPHE